VDIGRRCVCLFFAESDFKLRFKLFFRQSNLIVDSDSEDRDLERSQLLGKKTIDGFVDAFVDGI
jgi:hypothetical protein